MLAFCFAMLINMARKVREQLIASGRVERPYRRCA
jgi:S1-C subfamily serine protease